MKRIVDFSNMYEKARVLFQGPTFILTIDIFSSAYINIKFSFFGNTVPKCDSHDLFLNELQPYIFF